MISSRSFCVRLRFCSSDWRSVGPVPTGLSLLSRLTLLSNPLLHQHRQQRCFPIVVIFNLISQGQHRLAGHQIFTDLIDRIPIMVKQAANAEIPMRLLDLRNSRPHIAVIAPGVELRADLTSLFGDEIEDKLVNSVLIKAVAPPWQDFF